MAGMFYNIKETVEKLGITEEEIKELVRDGKLRVYHDGPTKLFKATDIDNFDRNFWLS